MPARKKSLIIVAIVVAIAVAVIVLASILTPNVNSFRPQIEQALGKAIGRQVQIGQLHASFWRGSLLADQISIADDPAYGAQPFLTAKSLSIGVDVISLVFSRDLRVHSFTFDNPQVQLLRTATGQWNFASLGGTAHPQSQPTVNPSSGPALNSFSVGNVKISNGTIALGRVGQPARLVYQGVGISAQNISQTSAFPFRFDAKTPGGSKLSLQSQVGPVGNGDVNRMPFQGRLKADGVPASDIQDLLAVLGYSLPQGSSLQGGTIQADLTFQGPLGQMVTSGPVKLSNVTVAGFSLESKLDGALGQAGSGTGNDTVIQSAGLTMQYASQGLRAEDLNIVIGAVGSVTGSGTVAADNSLNFRLVAKLSGTNPLAELTRLPFFHGGLPFQVQGTTSRPVIKPDFGGLTGSLEKLGGAQQGGGVGGVLGGLLKKKPQ